MDIYSILKLVGGLAFFLYGISLMSLGLEKIVGGKLEQLLRKMTSNPINDDLKLAKKLNHWRLSLKKVSAGPKITIY